MSEAPWKGRAASSGADYSAVELSENGSELYVLDQRLLPGEESYLTYRDPAGAATAIRDMVVRGAPAIGITAAYGMALAAREASEQEGHAYLERLEEAASELVATRPTAVNLAWAVGRCVALGSRHAGASGSVRAEEMAALARTIHRDDVASCQALGRLGAARLPDEISVLTHCNAGALATGGYGTALGVIRAAIEAGKRVEVVATETRPYLQGARLTAWELQRDGVPVTVIADNMVGHCMAEGRLGAVVVGADRIARNGDVANKIGTYGIACLARQHGIPFYVAAPWSTVDLDTPSGGDIVIEQRAAGELSHLAGRALVPEGVGVFNPAFDVTPARLVTAIITERGAFEPGELAAQGAAAEPAAACGDASVL